VDVQFSSNQMGLKAVLRAVNEQIVPQHELRLRTPLADPDAAARKLL
jgi:hypothetical protein